MSTLLNRTKTAHTCKVPRAMEIRLHRKKQCMGRARNKQNGILELEDATSPQLRGIFYWMDLMDEMPDATTNLDNLRLYSYGKVKYTLLADRIVFKYAITTISWQPICTSVSKPQWRAF
jgi:hypothetical protein